MTDPTQLVRTIAAWGIDSGTPPPTDLLCGEPLDPSSFDVFLSTCAAQRISGLAALAAANGDLLVTDSQQAELFVSHRQWMARALQLERWLSEIGRLLDDRGIGFVVLKGPSVAHLDYPDASMRCFGDVDLLIAGDDMSAAIAGIESLGGHRRFAEPRAGFDRRFTKGACVVLGDRTEFDLHRTLSPGPFGLLIDLDDLWSSTAVLHIGDQRHRALDAVGRFLHACYHAMLGDAEPRLVPLRDVVQTCPTAFAVAQDAQRRAARWQGESVVASAIVAARTTLGWHPPRIWRDWCDSRTATRRDALFLSAYRGKHRSHARQAALGVLVLPGIRTKLAYTAAQLAPVGADQPLRRLRRGLASVLPS